ncbi:3'-5' exonuclease [Alteromonas halophila]|uniref:Exonuclease domain-containing protein n=1 Tax=Alteromonas halophila TaxID=516698 RepID=A0A918JPH9_9ALTE|nr:3'-5' exonuclease [Alteromonas halophila]GGW92279.1 hypothetical protein GCM10007391_28270 [Alteromonas halophila]
MLSLLTRWLLGSPPTPPHWQGVPVSDISFLAIDLELTSLDVTTSQITSAGWVSGRAGDIDLDSAYYQVVKTSSSLEQSPVIHGLTADTVAQGCHVSDVLDALMPFAGTHIWVFHNARLDTGVLDKALRENGRSLDNIVVLDTLKYAVYQLEKQHQVLPPNSATLTVCRQRLGLPLAPAHNALDDALATLQLWFAQYYTYNGGTKNVTIDDFLSIHVAKCKKMGKKS